MTPTRKILIQVVAVGVVVVLAAVGATAYFEKKVRELARPVPDGPPTRWLDLSHHDTDAAPMPAVAAIPPAAR